MGLLTNLLVQLSLDPPVPELQLLYLPIFGIINIFKPLDLKIKPINLSLEPKTNLLFLTLVISIRLTS